MSPQLLAERYVRSRLTQDAKVAAVILRACPEFIWNDRPEETVDNYLRRLGCGTIRHEAVLAITETASVNGSRLISSLKVWQRHALADQLDAFAKGQQS